MKINNF